MNKRNKVKYDAEYIRYVEHGDSAAVFITRDIVRSIRTDGKWIDVLNTVGSEKIEIIGNNHKSDNDRNDFRWSFESFDVEIFPRKTKPIYPEGADRREVDYITWQTACQDIATLRQNGYIGNKYRIFPKLVKKVHGEYKTVEALWNKTFNRWVPMKWKTPSCEIRKRRIFVEIAKPDWEYHILSIKRLDPSKK